MVQIFPPRSLWLPWKSILNFWGFLAIFIFVHFGTLKLWTTAKGLGFFVIFLFRTLSCVHLSTAGVVLSLSSSLVGPQTWKKFKKLEKFKKIFTLEKKIFFSIFFASYVYFCVNYVLKQKTFFHFFGDF